MYILTNDETLNKCILNIINLFENNQVGYPNNFPVNDECTSYTIEGDTLKKWLAKYKLAENTSVEDTIAYFVKRYGIISENIKEARKIISIRYEMSTKGYSSTKPLSLAENVSRNVVAQISERNSDFPGVTITTQSSRKYNYGSLASHILGYIGKISEKEYNEEQDVYENDDYVGRTGIESLFENYLRGKKGKEEIEMTVDGTVTGETVTKAPEQGSTVVLTIDSKLQEVAETALKNNIEKIRNGGFSNRYDAKGGCVAVIDVHSGEILAMASNPDYDPNAWVGGISVADYNQIKENNSLFNKAISGSYAPGSIFKMVTALAGLESGAISTTEKINDTGIYTRYRDYQPRCWYYNSYHRGHGYLDVSGAIEKSCNYFFYETGDRMGIDNLSKYALHFGLGKKTGIELPNEKEGAVASKETYAKLRNGGRIGPGDVLNASIGQGDNNFTPMQIAKYISSIANGGNVVKPTIIKSILNSDGSEVSRDEITQYTNEKLGYSDTDDGITISQESVNVAKEGMRMAASEAGGTAYNIFKGFNQEVAGKTGSAEAGKDKDGNDLVNAWFVCFAPYEKPEVAVVVMIENGGHGNYAAEVARDVLTQYFGMNESTEINESMTATPFVEQIR